MAVDLVVIGASAGGLAALRTVLTALPPDFRAPVAIVQHRTRDASNALTNLLGLSCVLPVEEVIDKMPIKAGRVYVAPADYHLLVERNHFALSIEAPVQYSRPSIDVLFETAAVAYGKNVIGIILTGANRDGAAGASFIKKRGGRLMVQEPATAHNPVMPQAALNLTEADWILPLEEIGPFLSNL